jgi:hypothetical protein
VLLQVKIRQLEELLKRVDLRLHNHIISHEVQYLQFSFRWMNNLLLRELPLSATVRLWDTYLAERDGFSKFHLYVCAAFLIRWKADLEQKKDFQAVFRIRIHRIHMFLGLPDPDPSVRGMDPDPGSGSFYHQAKKVRKTLIPTAL